MLYHKKQQGCEIEETSTTDILADLLGIGGDSLESFMQQTRRIFVVGEINELTAACVNAQLQQFAISKEPVYMYISSPGGSLLDGYSIIDQMQLSPFPIYTITRGQAHSMAAIIAAYGTKKCRFVTPRSCMMLHSILLDLSKDSIEKQQRALKYVQDDYDAMVIDLASRIRLTSKQLIILMQETRWMNAKEAIRIGLVDKIWTPKMEHEVNLLAIARKIEENV